MQQLANNQGIAVSLVLSDDEAAALAQLAKRFSYNDAERLSNGYDRGVERDRIIRAICKLAQALASEGYDPR